MSSIFFSIKCFKHYDVLIDFAATHLCRIGFTLFPNESIKQKGYENPVIRFVINLH
jgi:hypothetical protein